MWDLTTLENESLQHADEIEEMFQCPSETLSDQNKLFEIGVINCATNQATHKYWNLIQMKLYNTDVWSFEHFYFPFPRVWNISETSNGRSVSSTFL